MNEPQKPLKPLESFTLQECKDGAAEAFPCPVKFRNQGKRWFLGHGKKVIGSGVSPGHALVDAFARIDAAKKMAQKGQNGPSGIRRSQHRLR